MAARLTTTNVIVKGNWNARILTPEWIARELFGASEGTALEIGVAVDRFQPTKIGLGALRVVPDWERVVIECTEPSYDNLRAAMSLAAKLIDQLPRTPLTAIGINLVFQDPNPVPDVTGKYQANADLEIIDAGFPISDYKNHRSIEHGDGHLNVIAYIGDKLQIEYNFNRSTNSVESLKTWLAQDIKTIQDTVESLRKIGFGTTSKVEHG